MHKALTSLLAIQAALIAAVAAGFYVYSRHPFDVVAVLYGGTIALVVSVLLAWRVSRAARQQTGMIGLYLSMLERMGFVVAMLVVGLALLRLPVVALIVGFVAGELAHYAAAGPMRRQLLKQMEGSGGSQGR